MVMICKNREQWSVVSCQNDSEDGAAASSSGREKRVLLPQKTLNFALKSLILT